MRWIDSTAWRLQKPSLYPKVKVKRTGEVKPCRREEVYRIIRNNPEAVVRLRLRIIKELERGKRDGGCTGFNASPSTIQRIKRRYGEEGIEGRPDRSRRPRRIPRKTPQHLEQEVLNIALREPTYGRIRIAGDRAHLLSP